MARPIITVAFLAVLSACVIPRTVERLQERNPPPEFGRPGWVRACAGTGAWVGGALGGVISIALLPVTYPLSLLAEDGLGEAASEELMFFPAIGCAAAGQFLLGAPPDLVDYVFNRAWDPDPPPPNTYELVPMDPPSLPVPLEPHEGPAEVPDKESGKEPGRESGREPGRESGREPGSASGQ